MRKTILLQNTHHMFLINPFSSENKANKVFFFFFIVFSEVMGNVWKGEEAIRLS